MCYTLRTLHYALTSRSIINMVSNIKSLSDIQHNGTEDAVAK